MYVLRGLWFYSALLDWRLRCVRFPTLLLEEVHPFTKYVSCLFRRELGRTPPLGEAPDPTFRRIEEAFPDEIKPRPRYLIAEPSFCRRKDFVLNLVGNLKDCSDTIDHLLRHSRAAQVTK